MKRWRVLRVRRCCVTWTGTLLTVSGLTGLGASATFLLKLYNKHLQVEEDVGEQHIQSQTNRILFFYAIK